MTTSQLALVTGGAGFIGSHLVEALMREGLKVRVLDNLATGHISRGDSSGLRGPSRIPQFAGGRPRALTMFGLWLSVDLTCFSAGVILSSLTWHDGVGEATER
jgi:NAD(P)-dependent dehydrogenase (short-subunit alcohol dehydrogenase family)